MTERTEIDTPDLISVKISTERAVFARLTSLQLSNLGRAAVRPVTPAPSNNARSPSLIDPKTELYGRLLFQGPMFQLLDSVVEMDARGSVITIDTTQQRTYYSPEFSQHTILGDPCRRDVLLQSAQLSTRGTLLPIAIDALSIFVDGTTTPAAMVSRTIITGCDANGPICSVVAADAADGAILEELNGYHLKQMSLDASDPAPEDWVDPGRRDAAIVGSELAKTAEQLSVKAPAHGLAFVADIGQLDKASRHVRVVPLLQDVLRRARPRGAGIADPYAIAGAQTANLSSLVRQQMGWIFLCLTTDGTASVLPARHLKDAIWNQSRRAQELNGFGC